MNLQVDFNDIDEQGRVAALLPLLPALVGSRAYLLDDEGNRCWGQIVSIEDGLAFVEPDWTTWATSHQRHEGPQGYWIMAGTLAGASQAFVGTISDAPSVWKACNTGDVPVPRRTVVEHA